MVSVKFFPVLIFTLSGLQLTSCASHLPGTQAVELSAVPKGSLPALQISAETLKAASSQYYRAFEISFKNNTDQWIYLDSLSLKFPQLQNQPHFLLGEDLNTYLESVSRRNAIEHHNRELLLGSLAVIGGATGLGARDKNLSLAGLGLASSTVAISAVENLLHSAKRAEFHSILPDNHVLKPFAVPPGLSMSRWLVISLPEGQNFQEMAIAIQERNQKEKTFLIPDIAYQYAQERQEAKEQGKKTHALLK